MTMPSITLRLNWQANRSSAVYPGMLISKAKLLQVTLKALSRCGMLLETSCSVRRKSMKDEFGPLTTQLWIQLCQQVEVIMALLSSVSNFVSNLVAANSTGNIKILEMV
uniref:Uncharacterized protein n=1 Tax=Kalanchoe fedtschenkoi TaxID=63787 RepID=A0A7N0V680_KALFE